MGGNKKREGKQKMDGLKRHFQWFDLVSQSELCVTGGSEWGWGGVGAYADHSRAPPPSRSQTLERRQAPVSAAAKHD